MGDHEYNQKLGITLELKEIQSPGTEEFGSLMLRQNTGFVLG